MTKSWKPNGNIIVEIIKFSLRLSNCLCKTINQRSWIWNRADRFVDCYSISPFVSSFSALWMYVFSCVALCMVAFWLIISTWFECDCEGNQYVFIFMWHQFNELMLNVFFFLFSHNIQLVYTIYWPTIFCQRLSLSTHSARFFFLFFLKVSMGMANDHFNSIKTNWI